MDIFDSSTTPPAALSSPSGSEDARKGARTASRIAIAIPTYKNFMFDFLLMHVPPFYAFLVWQCNYPQEGQDGIP
ncbi:hypothetical protein MSBRW_0440 [Methanosarcina barkeri str. Wiesmoor]|uniref:Uncharacterized protein n=1 Tax=Methanosarcina barkeri str. Wiesmoor TaxID=1434109 RepID=A0A0E3QIS1_METBA|nr:hypothetical protein MSBRW_0440 [Methanosarcina barkeri str. Wiesmoor]